MNEAAPVPKSAPKKEAVELTQELLDDLWQRMMHEVSLGDELGKLLNGQHPTLSDEGVIEFETDDIYYEKNLRNVHLPMLKFLREETGRPLLDYKIRLRQSTTVTQPYLAHEKFDKMREENPAIVKLRKIFNNIDM